MNIPRNIIESTLVPHTAFQLAATTIQQCYDFSDDSDEPICVALIGESRTGKSRALEEFYVEHLEYRTKEGLKVPILRTTTPSKPGVKGLVELMLYALGDPKYDTGTEIVKTLRLKTLMKTAETRMVMIDEFQHFVDKASQKVIHHMADWLKVLVDETKVVLVIAGLPYSQSVIFQNEQLLGRFLNPIVMPRFNWSNEEHREEFIAILTSFYETIAEYLDIIKLDEENIAFRIYCACGGLMGYLAKLLRQVVWNSISYKNKVITLKELDIAYKTSICLNMSQKQLPTPFSKEFESIDKDNYLSEVFQINM